MTGDEGGLLREGEKKKIEKLTNTEKKKEEKEGGERRKKEMRNKMKI